MLTDYWAHTYFDDPKALSEYEDEDFDIDSVAAELGYEIEELPDDLEELE